MIPVLDLSAGHAVLARGGQRDTYAPVRSRLVAGGAGGDPLALARAYREILDCDGRIGGFNFQWAWATGYLAGRAGAP